MHEKAIIYMLYTHFMKVIAQKIMFMSMTNRVNVELNLN